MSVKNTETLYINNTVSLDWLKNQAKQLRKLNDILHAEALDAIASKYNYTNWKALLADAKPKSHKLNAVNITSYPDMITIEDQHGEHHEITDLGQRCGEYTRQAWIEDDEVIGLFEAESQNAILDAMAFKFNVRFFLDRDEDYNELQIQGDTISACSSLEELCDCLNELEQGINTFNKNYEDEWLRIEYFVDLTKLPTFGERKWVEGAFSWDNENYLLYNDNLSSNGKMGWTIIDVITYLDEV